MEFSYKTMPDYNKDSTYINEIVNKDITNTSKKEILEYLEDCELNLKKLENEGEEIGDIFFQRIKEFKKIVQNELLINDPMEYGRITAQLDLFSITKEYGIKHKEYDTILEAFYMLREELMELNIFKKQMEKENEDRVNK